MRKTTQTLLKVTLIAIMVFGISACNETKDATTKKALFLVFNTEHTENFWDNYQQKNPDYLKELYNANKINYVLPFSHQPLKHPDNNAVWTNCVLIGLNTDNTNTINSIINHIKSSTISNAFVAADLINLQEGLDMFYSVTNGKNEEHKLEQIVEYVFSKPEARKKYYGEQYIFSGPAMQELHSNNMAGRFIGYEVEKRLFGDNFPKWDLIHVVGFTKEQSKKATPIFFSTWNKHAERAFGKGMTFQKKIKEWDKIRINIKSNATQDMDMTLKRR